MTALPTRLRAFDSRPNRGFSIVELMSCAAITAILLSIALPALTDLGRRQRLQSAAAELQADVHLARTTAMLRGEPIRLSWQSMPGGGACYVVHSGAAGQCSCNIGPRAACGAGAEAVRVVALPPREAISLTAATHSVLFDSRRGTVTPTATFSLGDGQGRALHLVVNIMGRVRSCSPDGQIGGVRSC